MKRISALLGLLLVLFFVAAAGCAGTSLTRTKMVQLTSQVTDCPVALVTVPQSEGAAWQAVACGETYNCLHVDGRQRCKPAKGGSAE